MRAAQHDHILVTLDPGIGLRQEPAFREAIVDAETPSDRRIVEPRQGLAEPAFRREREAQLAERPTIDDREGMLDHLAVRDHFDQSARRESPAQARIRRPAFSNPPAILATAAPVERRTARDAFTAQFANELLERTATHEIDRARFGEIERCIDEIAVVAPRDRRCDDDRGENHDRQQQENTPATVLEIRQHLHWRSGIRS